MRPKENTNRIQAIYLTDLVRESLKIAENLENIKVQLNQVLEKESTEKLHIVSSNQNLRTISRYYYGDIVWWKALGIHNKLDNPELTAGQELKIPTLDILESYGI